MKKFILFSVLSALCVARPLLCQASIGVQDSTSERITREFVDAFAKRDIGAMIKLVDQRVLWIVVFPDTITRVLARGRESLENGLRSQMPATTPPRMTLQSTSVIGPWVAAKISVENITPNSSSSETWISMLEIRNGLIQRIWQYPPWVSARATLRPPP
jgi:hypothetical protein